MRGVDFSNTSYRRMYLPTAAFKLLGCEAQSVYWALRSLFDPGGYFRLNGAIAAEAVAVEVGWPIEALEFIERGLDRLLQRQWVFYDKSEDALVDPDFYEAEHATKSGKQRARDSRHKKKGDEPPVKDPRSASDLSTADASKRSRRKIGFQMSSEHFSQDGLPTSSRLNGSEISIPVHGVDGHPPSASQLGTSLLGPMGCSLDRSERPTTAPTQVEPYPASLDRAAMQPLRDGLTTLPTIEPSPSASLGSDQQHPAHVDEPQDGALISMSIRDGNNPDESADQPASTAHVDDTEDGAPNSMSIEDDARPTTPTTERTAHVDEPGDAQPSMSIEADADSESQTVRPEGAVEQGVSWSMPEGGIEFGPVTISVPIKIRLVPASVTDSAARYTLVTFSEKCDAPVTNSPSQYPIPITQSPKSVVFAETGSVCAGAGVRARASPTPEAISQPPPESPPSIVEGQARSPDALPGAEPDAQAEPSTTRREQARKPGRPNTEPSVLEAEPPPRRRSGQARSPEALPEAEPNAQAKPSTARREQARKPERLSTEPPVPEAEPPPRRRSVHARNPDALPEAEPNAQADPTTTRRDQVQGRKRPGTGPPKPVAEPPPREAAQPKQGNQDPDSEQRFQEFARYVERCYRHSAKLDRGLNRRDWQLVREWFDLGIDASAIREAFAEEGEFEPGAVWSLGFYKRTVLRVWREQCELTACARMPDPPPTDFDQRLEDLIALIPEKVPRRADLVASMVELRGLDPETVDDRLQDIERQFLGGFALTVEQKQHLDSIMSKLAQRLPRSEIPRQRKTLALQAKRESLGLPILSLFSEELTHRKP